MTTRTASKCAYSRCNRITSDPSGRCPWHRAATAPDPTTAPPPPPSLSTDDPYVTESDFEGGVLTEWKIRGRHHRLDGPAAVLTDDDGSVRRSWWYRDNREHRIDGPAYVEPADRSEDEWWFHGKRVQGPVEIAKLLRSIDADLLLGELAASSFAVLLDEEMPVETILAAIEGGVCTPAGIREVAAGAPAEWVAAYEEGVS